jgi:Flp pilus assembly pilin Flp
MRMAIVGVGAFFTCRPGVTAVEYGMIAALIAAVMVGVVDSFGTNLNSA